MKTISDFIASHPIVSIFIGIGAAGSIVAAFWLWMAAYVHWYYRPKALSKRRYVKA